jgi:hypothetical protein
MNKNKKIIFKPGKVLQKARRVNVATCHLQKSPRGDVHHCSSPALVRLVTSASVPGLGLLLVLLMHPVTRSRSTCIINDISSCKRNPIKLATSVADPDPGSGIRCFWTPGSVIRDPE